MMAQVLACDVCGATNRDADLPPLVEPCRWQTAVADYSGAVCRNCQDTKTLSEIISHLIGSPGGTVDGAAKGPYLVRP